MLDFAIFLECAWNVVIFSASKTVSGLGIGIKFINILRCSAKHMMPCK